jgi:hypothetical protein
MKGEFEATGGRKTKGANRVYDEELKFGDRKVIRDGMGQGQVTGRERTACGWRTRQVSRLWQSQLMARPEGREEGLECCAVPSHSMRSLAKDRRSTQRRSARHPAIGNRVLGPKADERVSGYSPQP